MQEPLTIEDKKRFAESAAPVCWYEVAKRLHESAARLHADRDRSRIRYIDHRRGIDAEHSEVNRSVFLLAGFALENLLKAYIVYENPDCISDGVLSRKIQSHKLTDLLQLCNQVPYKARCRTLVGTFEQGLNSWARYPCGLSARQNNLELPFPRELWIRYERSFDVLSKKLELLLTKPWEGPHDTGGSVTFT